MVWEETQAVVSKSLGMRSLCQEGEACVYKKVSGSSVAFLILYVDDILLMGNNIEFLDSIKA